MNSPDRSTDDQEYIRAPDGEPASRRRLICLWRAVCIVAEHAFVDGVGVGVGDRSLSAWRIPRQLLRRLEARIATNDPGWDELQHRYRTGESGAARLAVVWVAMTNAGERLLHAGADRDFCAGLASEAGLSYGAAHRSIRLLARHLLAGPACMRAMIETFGVGAGWLSVLPFQPNEARTRLEADPEQIRGFLAKVCAAERAMPHPEAVALVQLAQHLRRPWQAICALPNELLADSEALRRSPFGLTVDMMLGRVEGLCDALDVLVEEIDTHGDMPRIVEQAAGLFAAHGSLSGLRDVTHLLDWKGDHAARAAAAQRRLANPLVGRLIGEGVLRNYSPSASSPPPAYIPA
jgi:hypothetical protein